jgi:glycosyltransferase involved in cell wall biosynthesis
MHIAILAPTHKSFIADFLPNISSDELPEGILSAPFIGTIIREFLLDKNTVTAITCTLAINNDYSIKRFKSDDFEWIVVPYRPHSVRFNGSKIGRILDFFLLEQQNMIKCIKEVHPDIVHAHWSYEYAGAAVNSGYPHLISVHDNAIKVFYFFKNFYRLCRLIMSEVILRKASYVSTVSPYMWLYTKHRCQNAKIIPNPTLVNTNLTEINSLISKKTNSLNSPSIIMINNGWDDRKNGKNGLLAFQLLKKTIPNASLHLFGQGSEVGGAAYKDAKSIGLDNINYYGLVPHKILKEELSKAHLLLHPSLEESFGVILIEAMAIGIPAIGGIKSGAVPWVLNNNLLEVDVTNAKSMELKMLELLSDPIIYKKVATACYGNVLNRFSVISVVQQYMDYYQEILRAYKKQ